MVVKSGATGEQNSRVFLVMVVNSQCCFAGCRNKAEPAGAIVNGKWVPSSGHITLQGPQRAPYCRNLEDAHSM